MLISHLEKFIYKEDEMVNEKGRVRENVLAILTKPDGRKKFIRGETDKYNIVAIVKNKYGELKSMVRAKNIVTNDGDLFYAQMAAGEEPTYAFANCVLGTGAVEADKGDDYDDMTPIAGSNKAPSENYPKTNDSDEDNTGKAVDSVTYKYYWTGADFDEEDITEGCITIAAPEAGSKVLTRFLFASAFDKEATDTLTLYVNHNFLGV
jgi:hypothetical protein